MIVKYIKSYYKNLLRKIGKPIKLEPFIIDIRNVKLIKINSQLYFSINLNKIKEFIDEGVKNEIIYKSELL